MRVRQHRHRGVAAVEGDHAAARVGGGAAEVEAVDRRARRQPVLPHLVRGDLALEDVAAGEADALLDVGRAEHLVALDDVRGSSGAKRAIRSMNCLATSSRRVRPVHLVGRVLAEDAQQVAVARRGARVVAGLDVDLAEADGGLAAGAALEGALGGVEALGDVDRRPGRPVLAGRGGPVRERGQRGVELHDGAADLPGLEAGAVVVGDVGEHRPARAWGRRCRGSCGRG